jgi:Na+-transporting NADH:ubiquinone oxidoreductase subunit B
MSLFRSLFEKPLDKLEEASHKGGILKTLWRVTEGHIVLIRTPKLVSKGSVHLRDGADLKRFMVTVIFALLPCFLWAMYNIGFQKLSSMSATSGLQFLGIEPTILNSFIHGAWHFLPMLAVSYTVGLIIEFTFCVVRDHEMNEGFLVTGFLIPLIAPPDIPLWMLGLGTAFGVFFGKEVFGGTGMNFLNPALTARAFLFFSYPGAISGDSVWRAIDSQKDTLIDGYSGATPLAVVAIAEKGQQAVETLSQAGFTVKNMFLGLIPGSNGETSVLMILIGAAILIAAGVGNWRIMLSGVLGASFMGILLNGLASESTPVFFNLPFYYHLIMGGFAFGIVFMATDPVSAAATNTGRWVYGFLIGVLTVIIRVLNPAYPEGMMLAILFMNMFAPLVDHYVVRGNIRRRLARVK